MKTGKKMGNLAALLCACLLVGCGDAASAVAPQPSDTAGLSRKTPEAEEPSSEATAGPAATAAPTPEPGASPAAPEQEYTDLSFLSEEQQQLYASACDASSGLYGFGDNLLYAWGYQPVADESGQISIGEDPCTLYDAPFDEFSECIHGIFTDNCLATTDYAEKFRDYNGKVAVRFSLYGDMVEGTTVYVREEYPDTYLPGTSTGEEVEFTLVSHYDIDGLVDNPLKVTTIRYPIRMVNTPDGWRMDEFHTTMYG